MLYRVHLPTSGIRTHNVIGDTTDCIGSCKSKYHSIMTTTAHIYFYAFFFDGWNMLSHCPSVCLLICHTIITLCLKLRIRPNNLFNISDIKFNKNQEIMFNHFFKSFLNYRFWWYSCCRPFPNLIYLSNRNYMHLNIDRSI